MGLLAGLLAMCSTADLEDCFTNFLRHTNPSSIFPSEKGMFTSLLSFAHNLSFVNDKGSCQGVFFLCNRCFLS